MNELHRLFHFCSIDDVKSLKKNINLISDINQPDKEKGWTLLSVSCYHHSRKCVEYLLSNEANINTVSNKGTTVLMYAKTKVIQNNDFSFLVLLQT